MATLSPWLVAEQAVVFLAFVTIVGNPLRRLLVGALDVKLGVPSLALRWMLSFATGTAVIPIVLLNAGLWPGAAGPATAWFVLLLAVAANLWLYRGRIRQVPSLVAGLPRSIGREDRWFGAILLAGLALQLGALVGLWVMPGDDAKLYSLITQRFVETQGIPTSWGPYAPPSWYVEHTHLLLPGFGSVAASLVYWTGSDVPSTVSVATSLFRALQAASLFVLVAVFTRRRLPALLAMGIYGLVIVEPTVSWFDWGGQAELSAVSLLPVACAAAYLILHGEGRSWRVVLWAAIITGGMSLLHPYAFFYFLAFLIPLTGIALWRWKRADVILAWATVAAGVVFAAAPVLQTLGPESAIEGYYSTVNVTWTPIFGWGMTPWNELATLGWRAVSVWGGAVVFVLLSGLAAARPIGRRERIILAAFAGWVLFLFLLHENNPNGLFLVRFPLWYRIDPNRTFDVTSFAAAGLAGVVLEQVFWRSLPHRGPGPDRPLYRRVWSRNDGRARLLALLAVVLLLGGQTVLNAATMAAARQDSPIQADDVLAFQWIQAQTPTDASFFVSWADAGTWIPVYTGRLTVFPFGVVTNYTLLADYQNASAAFASDPTSPLSVRFMSAMGVTYIYAGPSRIYNRPGFDAAKIEATGRFPVAYHQGSVWIFHANAVRAVTLWTADLSNVSQKDLYATDNYSLSYSNLGLTAEVTGPGYLAINFTVRPPVPIGPFTYLVMTWHTDAAANLSLDVGTARIIDRTPSVSWTESDVALAAFGISRASYVVLSVDGTGSCVVASLAIVEVQIV